MTVDEKYQQTLKDFLTNSQLVESQEEVQAALEEMLQAAKFENVSDDGGGFKTYEAVIENTTQTDFKMIDFNINLLDEDGVIVETIYDQVGNFAKGAKAKISFYTDIEFSSTQVTSSYWE